MPQVAAAKAAHFEEFRRAAARAAENRDPSENGAYNPSAYQAQAQPQQAPQSFNFPGQPAPGPSFARSGYSPAPLQYQPQPAYQQQYSPEPKAFNIPAGAKAPFVPAPLAEDGTYNYYFWYYSVSRFYKLIQ